MDNTYLIHTEQLKLKNFPLIKNNSVFGQGLM